MTVRRARSNRANAARLAVLAILLLALCAASGALASLAAAVPASGEMWMWGVLSGGIGLDDRYDAVARGADGSLFTLGIVNSDYGVVPGQLVLVKCNAAGDQVWQREWAVPGAKGISPMAVAVDAAGNAAAVSTVWDGTDRDMLVTKWSAAGAQQWTAVKSSADPSLNDEAADVVTDAAGNVYVCGAVGSGSSAVVVKYDDAADPAHPLVGLERWTHYTTGTHATASARATSIAGDGSGGLYVTGSRLMATGGNSVYVQKLSTGGASKWLRGWDGAAHKYDSGDVVRYRDGFVYVGGETETSAHSNDVVALRYSAGSGTRTWARTWDNPVTHDSDEISDLQVDGHGNAYITGTSFYLTTVKYKALLLKIGRSGTVKWVRTYYDKASDGYGSYWSLAVSSPGTVWTVGFVRTATVPMWVVARYAANGKRAWLTRWDGPPPGHLGGRGADACVLSGTRDLFVVGATLAADAHTNAGLAWLRR